jgi:hypothetical protein
MKPLSDDRGLTYQRSCFFTRSLSRTETRKLTMVPIAADRAILTSSAPGILQRTTVSIPLIVPSLMENWLFIVPVLLPVSMIYPEYCTGIKKTLLVIAALKKAGPCRCRRSGIFHEEVLQGYL